MIKRVLVFSILCLFILGLAAWAAKEKPKNETVVSDREQRRSDRIENLIVPEENIVTKYLTSPMPELSLPATKDTAGFTYYEFQTNRQMMRQMVNSYNNKRQFCWMYSPTAGDVVSGLRDVHYNSKLEAGLPTFGWIILYGQLASSTTGRAGYTGMDQLPDSKGVLAYHNAGAGTNTTLSVEKTTPGLGEFLILDVPDSIAGESASAIWPRMSTQKDPTSPHYIHIAVQHQVSDATGYTRCYQYFDSLKCQAPGTPVYVIHPDVVEPTSNGCYNVGNQSTITAGTVTSPVSRKVAFVWTHGTFGNADMYYVESTNGGDDWITAGSFPAPTNVTNYDAGGYVTHLWGDYSAVYDYNDNLHLAWVTTPSTASDDNVTLWHYSSGLPPSKRVRQVTSLSVPSYVDEGSNGMPIMLTTLGVNYLAGPRHNWLYCLWSQFNGGPDTSAKGFTNSELYVAASSNGGLSWSQPINVTNTQTNGCASGACRSENWASLAERVDSILHIQYIVDLDPGAFVNGEATGTKNPVRYLRYQESNITIPAVPGLALNPSAWAFPTLRAYNATSLPETLEVNNTGTATLFFKLDVPTAGYVGIGTTGGSIVEGGDAIPVTVTFNNTGSLSDTLLYDSIRVASNHGLLGGGESYTDTHWVYFTLVVTDSLVYVEWDTVNTGTGGIKTVLSNTGNIGHQESGLQMNYNGKDYVFDCSPLLVTPEATIASFDTIAASWLHERADYFPESHLQINQQPEFATWGITIATSSFAPLLTRLGGNPYQWFWWWWTIEQKDVFFENERVIVKYTKLYKNPPPPWWRAISDPSTQPSVLFGIGADWDVPSGAASRNKGGYNTGTNLIYQYSDSAGFTSNYGGFYFYYGAVDDGSTHDTSFAPWAARVQRNQTQMYPDAGYADDSLMKYMSITGWSVEQDSSQDMNIIISAINPAKLSGRTAAALVTAKYALVVSDAGLTGLLKPMCGNANRDDKVNVADVVYLVNFLFKGGPKPFMYYANANGDNKVTISDVVYLVNYAFKNGPKPICNYPIALP